MIFSSLHQLRAGPLSWLCVASCLIACGGGGDAGSGNTGMNQARAFVSDLYIAPDGSDENLGTEAAPLRTIAKASQLATPGTTVHVAPGIYPGGFETAASGTAAARIRYLSSVKWGAKIVPPENSSSTVAWWNRGDHVDIQGFEIDGTSTRSGEKWRTGIWATGSNNIIANNHAHHIAVFAADCTSNGGAGIISDKFFGAVNNDIIGNVVHHIGSSQCNSIHGIYVVANGNVKNNLVYNIGRWGIHTWHDASNIVIANNTVVSASSGILVGADTQEGPTGFYVANNIVIDTGTGIAEQSEKSRYGVNLFVNNLVYRSASEHFGLHNRDFGSIHVDPQFKNPSSNDYRLKSTSPAIDKGSSTHAPEFDLDGVRRPQHRAVDIGAFEFVES